MERQKNGSRAAKAREIEDIVRIMAPGARDRMLAVVKYPTLHLMPFLAGLS